MEKLMGDFKKRPKNPAFIYFHLTFVSCVYTHNGRVGGERLQPKQHSKIELEYYMK